PSSCKKETADQPSRQPTNQPPSGNRIRQPAVSHPPPPLLVLRTLRLLKETKHTNKPIIKRQPNSIAGQRGKKREENKTPAANYPVARRVWDMDNKRKRGKRKRRTGG